MKSLFKTIYYTLIISALACNKPETDKLNPSEKPEFEMEYANLEELQQLFDNYTNIQNPEKQDSAFRVLLDSLESRNQIPYTEGENALFMYYGSADKVAWAGDFNGWNPETPGFSGVKKDNSKLFTNLQTFPTDARLDYKIVTNDNNWILDPYNKKVQYSGFGPNSEVRMPLWKMPAETQLWENTQRGNFAENQLITSQKLGYQLQYRVYTPAGYEQTENLPVVYVTDGHEYADDRLGAMLIVMDNLIGSEDIKPIIAVFIDPRNPDNLSQNRRAEQYRSNPKFVDFVTEELIPEIDNQYKTNPAASARAILGTSFGGWNSAYFGLHAHSHFGLIAMHSPAFGSDMPAAYSNSDLLPIKIYMATGTINDTEDRALALKSVLDQKSYSFKYTAVNQGHSWGNWRGLIDEPLIYFFGK